MLGWVFDASARTTCRTFSAVSGHVPGLCLTNGGRPLVVGIAIGMLLVLIMVLAVRASRA